MAKTLGDRFNQARVIARVREHGAIKVGGKDRRGSLKRWLRHMRNQGKIR